MSSIIKGLIDESESVSVIYIDGKPSTKYANQAEARKDADRLRVKFPNKKIEIKQEMHETEAKKGADGKRCWKGKRYAGTKDGKDICVPVKEGVIVGHDKDDPEVAILGGAGTMSLSRLKKKAHGEATALANDISKGSFKAAAYNVKQLANTLNTIAAAEEEMKNLYFGEDTDMRFAAEKTPAVNPYGGLKDRSFRGAISENPDYPAVGYQEGGWRQVKIKPAGKLNEFDSFDNATSYRAHPAGELDEGDVVPFKKKKTEYDKYKDAFSKQHDDEHRHGVGWIECDYCGDVNCDYDCDGSQADGELEEDTSYGGGMGQGGYAGQSYRKFKPKMAGTHMKKESAILKGITGESI